MSSSQNLKMSQILYGDVSLDKNLELKLMNIESIDGHFRLSERRKFGRPVILFILTTVFLLARQSQFISWVGGLFNILSQEMLRAPLSVL